MYIACKIIHYYLKFQAFKRSSTKVHPILNPKLCKVKLKLKTEILRSFIDHKVYILHKPCLFTPLDEGYTIFSDKINILCLFFHM